MSDLKHECWRRSRRLREIARDFERCGEALINARDEFAHGKIMSPALIDRLQGMKRRLASLYIDKYAKDETAKAYFGWIDDLVDDDLEALGVQT